MAHTKTCVALVLLLLVLPRILYAQPELEYQNRGEYNEGIKAKPVSGYDIEVISVLVDYQEPADQFPNQLRVTFHLQGQTAVHLTVREQDYRLFYWLDNVKPAKEWQAKSINEFTWPTGTVLRQLDRKFNMYELGVLIRLRKETPASIEDIAPAILYHSRLPDTVDAYLFTMKTNGDTRLSCSVYREGESVAIMTQAFRRIPGGRPFTVRWDAQGAGEAGYTMVCKGYFLDTNQPVQQTVRFFHKPASQVAGDGSRSLPMSDIFISYSNKDRPWVEQFAKTLGTHGWSVWWDRNIPTGESFNAVIRQELELRSARLSCGPNFPSIRVGPSGSR